MSFEFVKGAYDLPPVYIETEQDIRLPFRLNIGAIVKRLDKYYIIKENGLEEVYYDSNYQSLINS